jgi:hypothetical protein
MRGLCAMSEMSFQAKLQEIWRLLAEAYEHYFSYESHCKSDEGAVSVNYPTFFEMRDGKTEPTVSIYSYCLGPNRNHYFSNIDEALTEVRKWHKKEMEYVPTEE